MIREITYENLLSMILKCTQNPGYKVKVITHSSIVLDWIKYVCSNYMFNPADICMCEMGGNTYIKFLNNSLIEITDEFSFGVGCDFEENLILVENISPIIKQSETELTQDSEHLDEFLNSFRIENQNIKEML